MVQDLSNMTGGLNSLMQQNMALSPWSLRLVRSLNSQLTGFYQYMHVIFGTQAYEPQQPRDDTVRIAHVLFKALETRRQARDGGTEDTATTEGTCGGGCGGVGVGARMGVSCEWLGASRQALKDCTDLDSLLQVTDDSGYNVLQVAVLRDDRLFLELLVSEGCDLNRGKCSLPLHLACRLGNLDLVRFLLRHGARANGEAGMCYPRPHVPVRHVPSRFHFLETDIYACDSDHQLPVMYAVQEDHVDVVRCLMEEVGAGGGAAAQCRWPPYRRQPLHYACRHGAVRSARYLTATRAQELNDPDEDGMTPLLHAVQWGKALVQHLVEAGARVQHASSKGHTALHLLYTHSRDPMQLYATTRFLLGTGLEADINAVDADGNSPLHVLMSQLNCLVDSFPAPHPHHRDPSRTAPTQRQFDDQVLDTLELLLDHNCDPNLVNASGVTAMHKLLLTFDFVISNDPTGITFETLPVREKYKTDFDVLRRALHLLLRHGASPNLTTGAGRTPLIMLLHSVLNVDASRLEGYAQGFTDSLGLLCRWGAQPSLALPVHITTVISLCKFGHKCLSERDDGVKLRMAAFLGSVLGLLLSNGLNANHRSRLRKREVEGDSGNLLVELVKLVQFIRTPRDLSLVYGWVLVALQWGADPDMEPYPSDSIICTSQSSIYLKPKSTQPVNHYLFLIQDFRQLLDGGYAERLLNLFYNSMGHQALFRCIHTAKVMSRFDPRSTRTPSSNFIFLVNSLCSQPRSLKQMARVTIYKALDRQLNLRVAKLPLPRALQRYLVDVE